jgi:uncharacterized membrane protein YfcA
MKDRLKLILLGIAAGFCNGLFGSGGGMIVVPCLEKYAMLEPHKAHATAIAVILPLSVVSIFKYASFAKVSIPFLSIVCIGGVIGSFIGAKLLKRFAGKTIKRIFGVAIIIASVRMVIG